MHSRQSRQSRHSRWASCLNPACPLQVQAATGQTAAAAAAVAAVVATEAKWDCNGVSQDSQGFTPSELAEEIADGRLQPLQDVIPLSHAGIPRSAGDVVQRWKAALDYAHQQAKLAGELCGSCGWFEIHKPMSRRQGGHPRGRCGGGGDFEESCEGMCRGWLRVRAQVQGGVGRVWGTGDVADMPSPCYGQSVCNLPAC